VVLALRGSADGADFDVTDVCFVPLGPQTPLPGVPAAALPFATPDAAAAAVQAPPDADAKYVALVSGLQLGAPGVDPQPAALLADWLGGHLGGRGEQALASRVVRLIVAGDTLCALPPAPGHVDAKAASRLAAPLREADLLLSQLAAALPVDLMPGRNDPSNAALPQQPLHACLLPHAARYIATLARVTNPHECALDGVRILGTSGQNVDDLYRCTDTEARLGLLASTLAWGHLAPSAPDTLACYPFHDRDPFLVGATPHILFAGNQPAYATQLLRGRVRGSGGEGAGGSGDAAAAAAHEGVTRIILVPSFATSGTIVLVNLATLACHPVTFSTAPLTAEGGGA
jgi:DNA polymerase delta subunit 2